MARNGLLNSLRSVPGQSGLIFLSLGIITAIGAVQYNIGTPARMGPGFFPFCLGILLAIVGCLSVLNAFRSEGEMPDDIHWRPLIAITSAVVVSGLLLLSAGLLIAVPALIIIASAASKTVKIKQLVLLVLALTAMSYGIFVLGLGMPIPLISWL